ncbi:unnamed protein product [Linum trigynum]|uniref:Secreted protein n=1 Tax=Linum trigynum TaxID=586398 RepID=A0AAV2CLZ8_9ROSI
MPLLALRIGEKVWLRGHPTTLVRFVASFLSQLLRATCTPFLLLFHPYLHGSSNSSVIFPFLACQLFEPRFPSLSYGAPVVNFLHVQGA